MDLHERNTHGHAMYLYAKYVVVGPQGVVIQTTNRKIYFVLLLDSVFMKT